MIHGIKKTYVVLLKKTEIGSAVAVRLTKYTGKSKTFIHPKHFLETSPWYTQYLKKNDEVLDLGCGNGQSIIKSAKYCKQITGIDLSFNFCSRFPPWIVGLLIPALLKEAAAILRKP